MTGTAAQPCGSGRVALLTLSPPSTSIGGVETFTSAIDRALGGVDVFCLSDEESACAFVTGARLLGLSEPARAWLVARKLRRCDPSAYEAVICNGMTAWPFALRRLPVPLVCVFHGNYAGYVRAVTRPRSVQRVRGLIWAYFERLAARAADRVVAVSPAVARDVLTFYRRETVTIPNAPDQGVFFGGSRSGARQALGLPASGDIALFVGRPTVAKGFDVIVALARALPDTLFVCAGPDAPDATLPNIHVERRPSRERLRRLYQSATYVVAPSQFEGCSYVPLEALACGTPVVTSATGLFDRDTAIAGVHVVASARDPQAYAEAIAALKRDPRVVSLPPRLSAEAFAREYRVLLRSLSAPRGALVTSCAS